MLETLFIVGASLAICAPMLLAVWMESKGIHTNPFEPKEGCRLHCCNPKRKK